MMTSKKWMATGLAMAMVATVMAGCSTKEEGGSTDGGSSAKPQELKIAFSAEPPALDPSVTTANASFTVMNATQEGLIRLDKDGKPTPGMAAELPKISEDGKTYTFKIREDAVWHDGKPVTAHDFEFSWKRTAGPESTSQYAFMLNQWVAGAEELNTGKGTPEQMGVKALDDKTLEVKLKQPVAFFTQLMSFCIFFPERKDLVEKFPGKYGADHDKLAFNGPFILESWDHEQSLTFKKNEKYWDAKNVKLEKITMNIVKDQNSSVNLYETDQVDLTTISRDQVVSWKDKPDFTPNPELTNAYVQFNAKKAPAYKNAKIRKALSMSVDRQAFVDVVLGNGSVPSTGFVPVGTMDGNGNEFRKTAGDLQPKFNPEEAKKLLAEGLKELNLTEMPNYKMIGDDTETARKTLEFLQAQWKQNLGIDMTPEPVPHKIRLDRSKNGDFDMVMSLWGADYNDAMTFLDLFLSTSSFNEVGYNSPKYDELIKAAQVEVDPKKRAQQMVDAEKVLMEDMPVLPLYFRTMVYLKRPSVKGLFFLVTGGEYELKHVTIE